MKKKIIYCFAMIAFVAYLLSANHIMAFFTAEHFRRIPKELDSLSKDPVFYAVDVIPSIEPTLFEPIELQGWAFCETGEDNGSREVGAILFNSERAFSSGGTITYRPDVKEVFPNAPGSMTGFLVYTSTVLVPDGVYTIGISVRENEKNYGIAETNYVLKKNGKNVAINLWDSSEVKNLVVSDVQEDVTLNIEINRELNNEKCVTIQGWAYVTAHDSTKQKVYVLLRYADGSYSIFDTMAMSRPDVAKAFSSELYTMSGFRAHIPEELIRTEDHEIAILVQDENGLHTRSDMVDMLSAATPVNQPENTDSSGGLMSYIAIPLNALMGLCYRWTGNYVIAIILFTFLTKVILFPIAMWTNRNGLKMASIMPALNRIKVKYYGDKDAIAEETQKIYKEAGYHPLLSTIPLFIQIVLLLGVIGAVRALLQGTDNVLSVIPAEHGGVTLLMPLAAGLSALLLGLAQNRLNPLQREQTRASQWGTNGMSIAISLFLGAFVPVGVGLYWICSNLFTIFQQFVLNKLMPPEKYVDYAELEESKKELAELDSLKSTVSAEDRRREKEDYKRFFSVDNKHLVFYSEKSGFYKYFQAVIEYLLAHSNVIIHYITSDPKDQIFVLAEKKPQIRPYYISENRLITLMMKMDAKIVVMTMPDLENFHIKRSYVRKDVEYIYMYHGIGSMNLLLRKGALSHYDTFFCVGQHQIDELNREEQVYGIPERKKIPCGYGLMDQVISAYEKMPKSNSKKPQILIAPSWQKDSIMDCCLDELLENLLSKPYRIVLRPHPEYCKRYPKKIASVKQKYKLSEGPDFIIQDDFSSNTTVFESDIVITDWSTICYEFSFATKKPTLFIDTPMKIMNPEYQRLGIVPLDIEIRNMIGKSISPEEAGNAGDAVEVLLQNEEQYRKQIEVMMKKALFSVGESGKIGGQYILSALTKKNRERVS